MKLRLNGSRGSAMVEAAMVFPLVILIVAGVIMTGLKMYSHVRADAVFHKSEAQAELMITAEDILRGKWTVAHGRKGEEKHEETEE